MSDDNLTSVNLDPLHLDLIALAMDRLACETDLDSPLAEAVMNLFTFFDELAESMGDEPTDPVLERRDNLIVVDFSPKED